MQTYYNRERKKGKHSTLVERCIIEANLKEKKTHKEISERIGVSTKTIQREVKRGMVELLNSDLTVRKEYVAEFTHQKYRDKKIFLRLRKKNLPHNKKYERHEKLEKRIKKNGGRSIEEMGTAYFYAHSYCSYERGKQ